MPLTDIHARLSTTSLMYFFVISVWAFWRFFRKQEINSSFWGVLAIAEILLILQVGLGIYLWTIGLRPARAIHLLYGFLIPALIPGAYFYTKGKTGRPEVLIYATTTIIIVGLLIRATFTGEVSL
jgi:predicted transporter